MRNRKGPSGTPKPGGWGDIAALFGASVVIAIMFLTLLLGGCRAKKVERTEVRQSDTLIVKKELIKAPELREVLRIPEICDSITGLPREVDYVYVKDGDSIQLLINEIDGLTFSILNRERTISEKDETIRSLREKLESQKVVVKYKMPWDWAIGLLVAGFAIRHFRPWRYII